MFCSDFVGLLTISVLISIIYGQRSFHGSVTPCRLRTGESGFCMVLKNCIHKDNIIKRYEMPQFCYYPFSRWICCPNKPLSPTPGEISRRKCQEYEERELITIEDRFGRYRRETDAIDISSHVFAIVGGFLSEPQEYPHMAALGYGEESQKQWHCGGSLISDKFVLTAAHCTHHRELGELRWIRLGDLNLEVSTDIANPQDFNVTKRIPHPMYKPPSQYNDIALIELDRAAIINDFVKPACLHTVKDIVDPRPSVIGWGQTQFGGDPSPHLQKVFLSFYTFEKCKKAYTSVANTKLPHGIDDETQLCAGGNPQDSCQGDSGGPLQIENFDLDSSLIYTVAGITSFGKSCGVPNNPGVYTRVSAFIGWIESIVWPNT